MIRLLLTLLAAVTLVWADVPTAFRDSGIVPEIIPEPPSEIADIAYKRFQARLGNEAEKSEVENAPRIVWNTDGTSLHTMLMIDPDAPGNGAFLHWLVVNIPGSRVPKADTIVTYYPPTPLAGTGPHRYIFLAYKQQEEISEDLTPPSRSGFVIGDFLEENHLGNPVAGNFFTVTG
uniref:PEBP-like protein n=1 Tax=Steinernema glaseri TaxID=37863 RepID=A0A1I7Z9P8_9BILA